MFEFREIKSENEYKLLELKPDAPFTQAWFFGKWQEMMGRKARRFEIRNNTEIFGFFQMIKYPMFFWQSFLYIPHGPILQTTNYFSDGFLKEFHKKLTDIAREENVIFIRFDLLPKTENNFEQYFKKTPIVHYHSSYFQPKFEWRINIKKTEDELIGEMHPKTRYNIRLAGKKGVKIEIIKDNFEKYFSDFFKSLEETAGRDDFNLHPKIYYENIFKTLDSKNAFLVVAKYGEKILLINLILLFGNTAYFVFGGSSGEYKNLMFSYLAQWEAVKEAKKRGFEIYNFGGVDVEGIYKTFGGISTFKKRFGGELLEHSDSYDVVLKFFWYYVYNLRKWLLNQK